MCVSYVTFTCVTHDSSMCLMSHINMCDPWLIYMCLMSHIHLCDPWLIHVSHVTYSHVWPMTHPYVSHVSHSHVWPMTHPYVSHVTRSHVCHMTHPYVSHVSHETARTDSCVTHMSHTRHPCPLENERLSHVSVSFTCVTHNSSICVACVTLTGLPHDSPICVSCHTFTCVTHNSSTCVSCVTFTGVNHDSSICVPWLYRSKEPAFARTLCQNSHDSFIRGTWLIHMCDMTQQKLHILHFRFICERSDSSICVPWLNRSKEHAFARSWDKMNEIKSHYIQSDEIRLDWIGLD